MSKIHFFEGYRQYCPKRWHTGSYLHFVRMEPHSPQSVYIQSRVVCGQSEGTSLPCLLGSSLSLACGNVTLLSPHDSLILTASHQVCRGSFTGQCMENFFKTVFASLKFLLCADSCHALPMVPTECQANRKFSIVTHTFPHNWPRFPPQLALWPCSLL